MDETGEERLRTEDRVMAVRELDHLREGFSKVDMPKAVLQGYLDPPASPARCIFAQVTECVSADLATRIAPCQFGGKPVCTECGCIASAGLHAIGGTRLAGMVRIADIFAASQKLGAVFARG